MVRVKCKDVGPVTDVWQAEMNWTRIQSPWRGGTPMTFKVNTHLYITDEAVLPSQFMAGETVIYVGCSFSAVRSDRLVRIFTHKGMRYYASDRWLIDRFEQPAWFEQAKQRFVDQWGKQREREVSSALRSMR